MTISEFYTLFPSESSCRMHLKTMREAHGVCCKKCHSHGHYWLKAKQQWQCRDCGFRTTLRSGTLFEASNLRLKTWFEALFLVSNSKKGLSACELQRQLGLKRYEPAWFMMQKIRKAMARVNEKQQESGEIEIDDAFFVTYQDPGHRAERLIREQEPTDNKGSVTRQKAIITVETIDKSAEKPIKPGKMRMFRTIPVGGETIWEMADPHGNLNNMRPGYRNGRVLCAIKHGPCIGDSNRSSVVSPWINTAIVNSKRVINGIYHTVTTKFAQLYLEEFSFKFNFRTHPARWQLVFREALCFHW